MIRKSNSLSSYGKYLDRKDQLQTNPQLYLRSLQRTRQNPMKMAKKSPKFIEGFDRTTSREHLNPFQIYNTRDANNQTNYQPKDEFISTKNAFYPVRRQSEPRLKRQIPFKQKYERATHTCSKFSSTQRNENIMTTRDLQTARKSFHNLDFDKQRHKSHSYIKTKQSKQTLQPEKEQFIKTVGGLRVSAKDSLNKIRSAHSFDSYTKRDFLSQQKLKNKGAPSISGAQAYKIPQEKFKGNWKVISQVKFNKVPDKNLSRYDRDCDAWYPKLQYQTKEDIIKKRTPVLQISKQTQRQINEVHSKYPIRTAI